MRGVITTNGFGEDQTLFREPSSHHVSAEDLRYHDSGVGGSEMIARCRILVLFKPGSGLKFTYIIQSSPNHDVEPWSQEISSGLEVDPQKHATKNNPP